MKWEEDTARLFELLPKETREEVLVLIDHLTGWHKIPLRDLAHKGPISNRKQEVKE